MLVFEKCCMFLYLLQYTTKYYYTIGEVTVDEFWFVTPHQELDQTVAYTFGLIGKAFKDLRVDCTELPWVEVDMIHSEGK
jgi:hypothetical protein